MASTDTAKDLPQGKEHPAAITDAPFHGQTVVHEGKEYTTIKEGLAHILVPPGLSTSTDPKDSSGDRQSVFYNPIQQFNRDLSVLAIRAFGEDLLAQRQAKIDRRKANPRRKDKHRRKQDNGDHIAEVTGDSGASKRRKIGADGQFTEVNGASLPLNTANLGDNEGQLGTHATVTDEDLIAAEKSASQAALESADQVSGQNIQQVGTADSADSSDKQPQFKLSFRILDALSATGLRALRFSHELPFVTSVTANDMSKKATEAIALNVKHNKLENTISTSTGNALAHMYSYCSHEERPGHAGKYDVIDLDPYGTAAPFLDAAVQALNDGGLLCVTCTDSGVFASTGYLEKTFSQYGGLPVRGLHSHEGGLRLVLNAIASSAARYGIAIEPLLSLSIDYYVRLFVRIRKSPAEVKYLAGKTMLVYACDQGCGAWQTQFLARNVPSAGGKDGISNYKHSFAQAPNTPMNCPHCGKKTHLEGPMWGGPIHNPAFIQKILSYLPDLDGETYGTIERIEGMLQTAYEELIHYQPPETPPEFIPRTEPAEIDPVPFYFIPSALARILRAQAPSDSQMRGALRHAGYKATRTHAKPGAIKTDASWETVWEIMREWVRQRAPVKDGALTELMPGYKILRLGAQDGEQQQQEKMGEGETQKLEVVFDEKLGQNKDHKRLKRYQINPRENWGPMARAK